MKENQTMDIMSWGVVKGRVNCGLVMNEQRLYTGDKGLTVEKRNKW